jgi:sRNA-binding regulator protein Hfq
VVSSPHDKYSGFQKAIERKNVKLKVYVRNVRLDSEVRKVTDYEIVGRGSSSDRSTGIFTLHTDSKTVQVPA